MSSSRQEWRDRDAKLRHVSAVIRTFLVVQWLGICLPMQRTQVQSLVGKQIPQATGQLSLPAATAEPTGHSQELMEPKTNE